MSKLLDLLGERRRRQAGDDVVRFLHWANFDKTAICAAGVGQHTMLEQKPGELFDGFVERASANATARGCRVVWLHNMYVKDAPCSAALEPYRGAAADR